ncbi:neuronal acetylcholine receptor subunit alpha-6-like [Mytilus californianus]|uniref:neuronal acetylcholine receptor subunit alpha-6-like n=1 Tax=Mytilus californianus TaxID=6549 RepID=UPI0022455FD9|nr:neuronal acetylcholine receptor subunit alpha-6-like [Mytilus californianus]
MEWNSFLILQLLMLNSGTFIFGSRLSDVDRLYSKLFMDYNKKIRPGDDQSLATRVNVSFNLGAIQEFDEVNGKFAVIGFFRITWHDSRMTWNTLDYNNTHTLTFLQDDVWKPTLVITNPFCKIDQIGKDFMTVRYFSNGLAYWTPGEILISSCSVDITYFPFDEQICTIRLMAWGTLSNEILLQSFNGIELNYFSEHGTWRITSTAFNDRVDEVTGLSLIDMSVSMKRRPGFYVINVVLPVIFLMALNSCVFLLPPDSGERVSYAITVLLAISVFLTLIGNHLPKTSEPMSLLGYFLIFDLVFSSLTCLSTMICLRLQFRNKNHPIPSYLKWIVLCCRRNNLKKRENWVEVQNNKSNVHNSDLNACEGLIDNNKQDISWRDICKALDTILLRTSFVVLSVSVLLFFMIITKTI